MDVDTAADLTMDMLFLVILASTPAMVAGMIVGLVVSIIQSITSIQEQTLSFVPKIIITLVTVVIAFPWIITKIMEYTEDLYASIPYRLFI